MRVLAARVEAHYAPDDVSLRVSAGFGARRRSYVEMPNPLVNDHPTGWKTRFKSTLDGELDELLWRGALTELTHEHPEWR